MIRSPGMTGGGAQVTTGTKSVAQSVAANTITGAILKIHDVVALVTLPLRNSRRRSKYG